MGNRNVRGLQTVAPGVQRYLSKDGSFSYRITTMVNGRQLITRTIPGGALVEVAQHQNQSLDSDEAVLECQRIRLRLKLELEGGASKEEAWDRVIGSVRQDVPFDDFTLNVYLPSRAGEITNPGHGYTTKKLARTFGSKPIKAIDYDTIRSFVNELKSRQLSASRIRDYTGVLSGIFAVAVRKGIVNTNPARRQDKQEHRAIWPPEPSSPRAGKFLSADEVDILIRASQLIVIEDSLVPFDPILHTGNQSRYDTRWLGDLICFAFETGIRLGALQQLTLDQISAPTTEHHYWHVHLYASQVKTRRARVVPLSQAAQEVVDRRSNDIMERGEEPTGSSVIFRGRWGQLSPKINTAWVSIVQKAKLLSSGSANSKFNDIRFHDLRASWAVDLLSRGANLNEVQMIGGWSTLSAMMRYVRACETNVESVQLALENRRERH